MGWVKFIFYFVFSSLAIMSGTQLVKVVKRALGLK